MSGGSGRSQTRISSRAQQRSEVTSTNKGSEGGIANCRNIRETVRIQQIREGVSFTEGDELTVGLNFKQAVVLSRRGQVVGSVLPKATEIVECIEAGETFGAKVTSVAGSVVYVLLRAVQ